MSWDDKTQKRYHINGAMVECGEIAFTTTGTTIEIPTYMTTIFSAVITPKATTTGNEVFYCDRTVTNGGVTLTRQPEYVEYATRFGADDFSSNNLVEGVLCTVPRAMVATGVVWANGATAWGGSPVLNIGYSEDGDPDDLVNAQAITGTARATTTVTTFASTAVAAGTDVRYISTGGTTTDPAGASLTLKGYIALTSGLKCNYTLIGL